VARLFAAGLIPGLMLGLLYAGYIYLRCRANPALAPAERIEGGWRARLAGLVDLAPVAFLIVLVLGGIYSGLATPSEAAALGVAGTLAVALLSRQLSLADLMRSALAAARTTAMLGTAFAAAAALSTTMGLLHLPQTVADWISSLGLSPIALIVVLGLCYILLGCVLESVAMILMTMPITFPLVMAAGFDPIWFGVFIVLVVEMGLVTPPIGFNLFVIRGITGYPIGRIARGAFPFFLLMVLAAGLLVAFPGIALWLPGLLFG
jgi:tripartite ATP-independent transporter DctM subunit